MQTILLVAGATLPVISAMVYTWDIIQGKVRPQITTRFLLAVITILSFVSLLAGHDHSGVWLALGSAVESGMLWVLSWWKGIGTIFNPLDMTCLVLCVIGITVWLVSGQSVAGLLASIVADFVACVPSLYKTIRLPHTETATFYALGSVAGVCVLLSTPITFLNALFPLYICLVNALFVGIIIVRRTA